jgi:Icc-related predicted phosphoesterase
LFRGKITNYGSERNRVGQTPNAPAEGSEVDLFLTHEPPFGTVFADAGSKDILKYIREYKPRLHFCGHYHEDGGELEVPGETRSFILNEVNFRKPSRINPGCIAILEINDSGEFQVEILNDKWLMEYKRSNFRMLIGRGR